MINAATVVGGKIRAAESRAYSRENSRSHWLECWQVYWRSSDVASKATEDVDNLRFVSKQYGGRL